MEGPRASGGRAMTGRSGKGHRDENFPVASKLLRPEHRAPIMAFYRFARVADDIADAADLSPSEKLHKLGELRRGLDGDGAPEAVALARTMAERGIDPIHAHELLDAFTQDVTVRRYADWDSLIGYCRLSAMPVGRFVLDVHGEDRATWPLSDALCAALQVINHLQDCAKDYRALDRIYIPADMLAASGAEAEDLALTAATPALRDAIVATAARTRTLLEVSAPFAGGIRDRRLAAEVAIIQRLAESLTARLLTRDPLSERVHHRTVEAVLLAGGAALGQLFARRRR
ncbi:squalene synthase HpnC [Sphingomonas changbaiensis NBRC 104936]|uniref:Squalene synthase HpnC n=1 Tax=Sphingomonas changbaiensis NBRC 104936 TaxID=1219043 RepID=A0A0E9MRR8_9SPHN|nr:squalene synthase HpnC [Sphingomonas changbaiensis]GAO40254.1 squalene synthase HpnC [Sphingomonas changbaiensis NBRC 104936]